MRRWIAASLVLSSLAPGAVLAAETDNVRATLATLDARQKEMVARADIVGLASLAAPDLIINAPNNRVVNRAQFLDLVRTGQLGTESFSRTVESITITGDIGVVMGSEIVTPTAKSDLGRTYGVRPLKRRYTNVYQRISGRWRWLARHANIVPATPAS